MHAAKAALFAQDLNPQIVNRAINLKSEI